ncbi:hypothetical protein DC31_05770 [Microbacterium sp. CH12i]|uniref:hypothetical protein n=1 Tax=Microbacterium sp. CH12i TaxID=1479651 RepID=UPI000461BB1A|nr:hypothetical protein [Microbacterium sp. CH12i]KDA04645.1 hypothetical protein DC31_05770 [Microbacterium sp. CH12i]
MIVVNVNRSYAQTLSGELTLQEATEGDWYGINDAAVAQYGDVLVGVWNNRVVSVYDIVGHVRVDEGTRVRFQVQDSAEFGYLVGQPSPVGPWKAGQARPIVYVDTDVVRHGDAPQVEVGDAKRAVVRGYVLSVDDTGVATIIPPAGGSVLVSPASQGASVS